MQAAAEATRHGGQLEAEGLQGRLKTAERRVAALQVCGGSYVAGNTRQVGMDMGGWLGGTTGRLKTAECRAAALQVGGGLVHFISYGYVSAEPDLSEQFR
jgi:hypothetical protein